MKTPYFLIHTDLLEQNICDFQKALSDFWPNSRLSYSVKTNSLPWLLEYLQNKSISAEVVSDEEYLLAQKCGYDGHDIIYNGPIKSREYILQAIEQGAYINLDSKQDIKVIKDIKPVYAKIGIRVNLPIEIFDKKDIEYTEDGFRFGFSDDTEEFSSALHTVLHSCSNVKLGLHLHCNSITRSIEVYKAIARYAVELIKKYDLQLSFIDIGGGFFGGVSGKTTPREYISSVYDELGKAIDPRKTELIVEPGSAIIGSTVDLVTSVVDVKQTKYSRIVTTDGSRVHIDPLWNRTRYMYTIETHEDHSAEKQIICGYTCMDHDRIMIVENEKALDIGDRIIYHRVGAYSMTFGGMFIRYYPDVYAVKDSQYLQVRKRISPELYYDIQGAKKC